MNKEKPKTWNNVSFKTLAYEEQTKMKHHVLAYYISQWLGILGSWSDTLNYIDGFGGIGAFHTSEDTDKKEYLSESYGSPIFTTETIRKLQNAKKIKKVNIVVIDTDQNCLENVKKILKFKGLDSKEEVIYIHGDFDKQINLLLNKVKKLAPTFFMVDPFGFSQIKLGTIKRIMENKYSEVLLNFMYNAIQRFVSIKDDPKLKDALEKHFNELFGCEDWKKHIDKRTDEKEMALCSLFRKKCKEFSDFVYPFRLSFPDKKMPYYYLFHLSNHWKGCSLMKDSFAKFNTGNLEYKSKKEDSPTLFDCLDKRERGDECGRCLINDVNENSICKDCFLKKFKGKRIKYEDLIIAIIDQIPQTQSEIRKGLQDLEKEGKITVEAHDGRKRTKGIEIEDVICFNNAT